MQGQEKKNEIFISYSRRDSEFISEYVYALKVEGVDPWFDKDDIPEGRKWWNEIQKGIVGANAFVFVISAGSLQSMVCHQELSTAIRLSKKIIPLLYTDVFADSALMEEVKGLEWTDPEGNLINARDNWNLLKDLNFIRYCDDKDLQQSVQVTLKTMRTDYDHLEEHTRLLSRAIEWEQQNKNRGFC
jgi:hypothetical protein